MAIKDIGPGSVAPGVILPTALGAIGSPGPVAEGSPVSVAPFSIRVLGVRVMGRSGRLYAVSVDVSVVPEPGFFYASSPFPGEVLLTFAIDPVEAESEAEAVYKAVLHTLEHELLEHLHVNGIKWKDPHAAPTPMGSYIRP